MLTYFEEGAPRRQLGCDIAAKLQLPFFSMLSLNHL
jgi:hypothetical protein